MPRLLAAQDVAGAADLEVGQGDLEARPELRRVEDRLEPLPRLVRQSLATPVEQVRVRPSRRPADPPAELVELTAGIALFLGFSKIAVSLGQAPESMPTMVVPTPDWPAEAVPTS